MKFIRQHMLYIVLLILLIADLCYSYYQYSSSIIDGDLPAVVMEERGFDRVLKDPLGIAALSGERYPATNRFTAHAIMAGYFKNVPFLLQHFMSPVESLYTSIAIIKIFTHLFLLATISYFVSGFYGFKWKAALIAAVLISPLIEGGFAHVEYFKVMDVCVTYVMFYPLPIATTLLFFLPFYRYLLTGTISRSPFFISGWMFFTVAIVLFGPLPAPIILIMATLIFAYLIVRNFARQHQLNPVKRLWHAITDINKTVLIVFTFAILASIYSLYVGTKNSENGTTQLALSERFLKLIHGIYDAFFVLNSGFVYIMVPVLLNIVLLYIFFRSENRLYFKVVFFLAMFCILYIFLLPFGGYRWYRPLMLRRDTLTPVLCIIFFCWGTSSLFLVNNFRGYKKAIPLLYILPVMLFYTKKDKLNKSVRLAVACEKASIEILANSKEDCVKFEKNCLVASWAFNTECQQSAYPTAMFEYYNITPKKVYFYFDE